MKMDVRSSLFETRTANIPLLFKAFSSSYLGGYPLAQDDEFRNTRKGNRTSLSPCFSCRTVAAALSISQGRCQLEAGRVPLIFIRFLTPVRKYHPGFRKSGLAASGKPEFVPAAAQGKPEAFAGGALPCSKRRLLRVPADSHARNRATPADLVRVNRDSDR